MKRKTATCAQVDHPIPLSKHNTPAQMKSRKDNPGEPPNLYDYVIFDSDGRIGSYQDYHLSR